MKLRLLLLDECNRRCEGCCNKQWDLTKVPVCEDYSGFEMVLITGGEPMLRPDLIKRAVTKIRKQNSCPIVLYTAHVHDARLAFSMLTLVDGITLTLHEQNDVDPFYNFARLLRHLGKDLEQKQLRLNMFKGVEMELNSVKDDPVDKMWRTKRDIVWIDPCPLPEGEVFMRFAQPT